MFRFIKPPYARMFYVPCCVHDDDYERGGDSSARRAADRRLFTNCATIIHRESGGNPWRIAWLIHIAMIYYISVRTFGRFYFNFKR
ncbi:MAG: hypothetical protein NC131_07440 [Roseburia sp.]|nr:hypothetical protein [Roseburia sp.]